MRNNQSINDIDNDLILYRYHHGYKLIKPEDFCHSISQDISSYSLLDFLNLPVKIVFMDKESRVHKMNESNAIAWGSNSTRETIGKTICDFYQHESASFSLLHDKKVMSQNKLFVEEEQCRRVDDANFQAITAKMPCYNGDNNIIGIIGLSMTLGLKNTFPVKDSLETFSKLIFANIENEFNMERDQLCKGLYLTKREREVLNYTMKGYTAKLISNRLHLSARTVEQHLENIKIKLDVRSKSALIEKAHLLFRKYIK